MYNSETQTIYKKDKIYVREKSINKCCSMKISEKIYI